MLLRRGTWEALLCALCVPLGFTAAADGVQYGSTYKGDVRRIATHPALQQCFSSGPYVARVAGVASCLKAQRNTGTVAAARVMTCVLMLARQGTYYGDFKGAGACSFQVGCTLHTAHALLVSLAPRSARPALALSACGTRPPRRRKRAPACPPAACSTYPLSPAQSLRAAQYGDAYARPWSNKLARGVAVNAPQYGGSQPCGMCIAYRGTGKGAGADPVPAATQYALVTDLCPECAHGALAMSRTRPTWPLYYAEMMH